MLRFLFHPAIFRSWHPSSDHPATVYVALSRFLTACVSYPGEAGLTAAGLTVPVVDASRLKSRYSKCQG